MVTAMWHSWPKLTGVLMLLCLDSLVHTEGFQAGIICKLINDAGGVVKTFKRFDCSSCWFHCIMSPTCVKIYYTYDGACNNEESQVENFTDQRGEVFKSPSGTCLQLDEMFGKPLADGCPSKIPSVHRMLKSEPVAQMCTLYVARNIEDPLDVFDAVDLGSISCHECQSRCQTSGVGTSTPCLNFYYTNDNICYSLYFPPNDPAAPGKCDTAEAQLDISDPPNCTGISKGDPHFRGFGNQPFEFQGFPGGIFNLYSDPAHQVNALLASVGDPDRTYITAVGIMYGPNRVQVLVSVQHCILPLECRLQVQFDKKFVVPSDGHGRGMAAEGGLKLQVTDAFQGAQHVHVFTPALAITITKGIGGLHLDVGLRAFPGVVSLEKVHGVLGQTMGWPSYPHAHLVGDEMDYATSHLFATDSMFAMFVAANASAWHAHI